jgi:hypothetical protein
MKKLKLLAVALLWIIGGFLFIKSVVIILIFLGI